MVTEGCDVVWHRFYKVTNRSHAVGSINIFSFSDDLPMIFGYVDNMMVSCCLIGLNVRVFSVIIEKLVRLRFS